MNTIISNPSPATAVRLQFPDALRGIAVLAMIVFHLCYDLDYFEFLHVDFSGNLFWVIFQKTIVSVFVLVAGISLGLTSRHGIRWHQFWRREVILLGCAALVSIASYILFPGSWIFFGILHFMALASVLALPFVCLGPINVLLGGLIIGLPWLVSHPVFNITALQWLGLNEVVVNTKDYTPFLPWFGVMLMGVFWGSQIEICRICIRPLPLSPLGTGLQWLGKHSLAVYMLHQPILFGLCALAATVREIGVTEIWEHLSV